MDGEKNGKEVGRRGRGGVGGRKRNFWKYGEKGRWRLVNKLFHFDTSYVDILPIPPILNYLRDT